MGITCLNANLELEKNLDYTCFDNYTAADLAVEDSFIEWVYSDGNASKFWNEWIDQNAHKAEEIEAARFLVLALGQKEMHASASEINEAWDKVAGAIDNGKLAGRKKTRVGFLRYLTAAMTILGLIYSTFYLIKSERKEKHEALVVKHTEHGQQLTTILPDGSKVILNAGSRLAYSEAFGDRQRLVNLSGEAYFDIRHNPELPFVVKVGKVEATVLGTTFNIKAYRADQIEVALESGAIQVADSAKEEAVQLAPGEILRIDSGKIHEIQRFDHKGVFGWKSAYLCFTRSSFKEAIESLERWYGVDFIVEGDVQLDDTWKFHGKFHDKSLAYVLHTLSYPNLFKYEIIDKQVTIY